MKDSILRNAVKGKEKIKVVFRDGAHFLGKVEYCTQSEGWTLETLHYSMERKTIYFSADSVLRIEVE